MEETRYATGLKAALEALQGCVPRSVADSRFERQPAEMLGSVKRHRVSGWI
jgi:hypothetical protein